MAFAARLPNLFHVARLRGEVRAARILATLALSAGLILGALHLGPVMPAGADLANPGQQVYAANLWGEVQASVVVIGVFLPWLVYGLLWRGASWGSGILIVVATAGTVLGTWITVVGVDGYTALPRSVNGVISQIDGRSLRLTSPRAGYYLALSDSQLTASRAWLKPGSSVTMWVSPRGQVGDVEPAR